MYKLLSLFTHLSCMGFCISASDVGGVGCQDFGQTGLFDQPLPVLELSGKKIPVCDLLETNRCRQCVGLCEHDATVSAI